MAVTDTQGESERESERESKREREAHTQISTHKKKNIQQPQYTCEWWGLDIIRCTPWAVNYLDNFLISFFSLEIAINPFIYKTKTVLWVYKFIWENKYKFVTVPLLDFRNVDKCDWDFGGSRRQLAGDTSLDSSDCCGCGSVLWFFSFWVLVYTLLL